MPYDYTPLSDDLAEGAKGFVDRYVMRLRRVESVADSEEQSRILSFLELQLFLLGSDQKLNKGVQAWARSELESVKIKVGKAASPNIPLHEPAKSPSSSKNN